MLRAVERLESRELLYGDTIAAATSISFTPNQETSLTGNIGDSSVLPDVDLFSIAVQANDVLSFDIDAREGNLSQLDSILRLFDANGNQLAVNDDGTDPDTQTSSLDSYIQFTAPSNTTLYIGVSGFSNFNYNPTVAGSGSGSSTGDYRLEVMVSRVIPTDAGDRLSTASSVSLTSGQTHTIADQIGNNAFAGADVDLFAVSLQAGDSLVADIDASEIGLSSIDSILRIFNSSGTQLAVNDDASDPDTGTFNVDSALEFAASSAGTYYIGVSGYSNFSYNPATANSGTAGRTGAYRLLLALDRPVVQDAGDTLATARSVSLSAGQTTDLADEVGNNSLGGADVDLFAVTLQVGDTLIADIDARETGLSSLDSILRIFNASGTQLAVNDDANDPDTGASSLDSAIEFSVTTAGTYYVGVSGYSNFQYNPTTTNSGRVGSSGAYRLLLALDRPIVREAGDTLATAQSVLLTAGQTTDLADEIGNSALAGADVDVFAVTLQVGDTLIADIDASETALSSVDSILRIFNASGTQLAVNDDASDPDTGTFSVDSAIEFAATTAGTYYVGVSGYSNFQYNPATSNSGIVGSTGAYRLFLTLERPIVREAGDTIATAQSVLLTAGQTSNLADEIGNNAFSGSDVDLFAVTLQAGDTLIADVDASETGLSSVDSILRIFNASGTQLTVNDDANDPDTGTFSVDSALELAVSTAGTYYVGVSGYSNFQYNPATSNSGIVGSTGAYRLLLTLERPIVREAGDTLSTAQAVLLAAGQTTDLADVIGNNAFGGADVDLFAVQLQAGDALMADIDASEIGLSSVDSVLRLFNSAGTQLAVNDDAVDPESGVRSLDSALEYVVSTAGTYFIGVSSFANTGYNPSVANSGTGASSQGAYRLILAVGMRASGSNDVGNSIASARPLVLNAGAQIEVRESIGNSPSGNSDVDLYGIDLLAGDILSADVDARETGLTSTLDSVLRIFGPTGTALAVNDDANDPDTGIGGVDSALEFAAPTDGRYFVGVSSYSNFSYNAVSGAGASGGSSGDYSLSLARQRNSPPSSGTRNAQVVWLNFEGGSATNGWPNAQRVPRFESTDAGIQTSQRQQLIDRIVQFVRDDFVTSGSFENQSTPLNLPVTITTSQPASGPYMTVFIGGNSTDSLGIAERVDIGNHVLNDNARVFSTLILQEYGVGRTFDEVAFAVADTISHEMGHNLGLSHVRDHGRMMQTGALDTVRTDNERFGEVEALYHTSGAQNSVQLLQSNLRTIAADASTSASSDAADVITPVGQTVVRRGRLEFDGDTDNYDVQLSAGQLLRVDVDARQLFPVDASFTATVRNTSGVVVAQSTFSLDPVSGFALDPYLVYSATTTGVFTVSVSVDFGPFSTASAADYVLNIERLTPDIADSVPVGPPDAVLSDAKDFVLNAARPKRTFTESDGDRVTVHLRSGSATVRVQLAQGASANTNISTVAISNASTDAWVHISVVRGTGDGYGRIGDVIVESTAPLNHLSVTGVDVDRLTLMSRLNRVTLTDVVLRQSVTATQQISQFLLKGNRADHPSRILGTADFLQQVNRMELNRLDATATLILRGNAPSLKIERLRGGTVRAERNAGSLILFQDFFGSVNIGWTLTSLTVGAGHVPASMGLADGELSEQNPTIVQAGFHIRGVEIFGELNGSISAGFTLSNVTVGGVDIDEEIEDGRTLVRSPDGAAGDSATLLPVPDTFPATGSVETQNRNSEASLIASHSGSERSSGENLQSPFPVDVDSAALDAWRIHAIRQRRMPSGLADGSQREMILAIESLPQILWEIAIENTLNALLMPDADNRF